MSYGGKQQCGVPSGLVVSIRNSTQEYNATVSSACTKPVLYTWESDEEESHRTNALRDVFNDLKENILLGRVVLKSPISSLNSSGIETLDTQGTPGNSRQGRIYLVGNDAKPIASDHNVLGSTNMPLSRPVLDRSSRTNNKLSHLQVKRGKNDGDKNTLNACPLCYHISTCSVLFISDSSIKSRISRRSVGQTRDRTRRGLIAINGHVVIDWETRDGDVFLLRIDHNCKVIEKLTFKCKITRAKDLLESPAAKYLDSLPNGTVVAGVAYGNSRLLFKEQLPYDLAGTVLPQPHNIIKTSFLFKRGFPGLGRKIVDPGQDYQINETTFSFGHPFNITIQNKTYSDVIEDHPDVAKGGHWKPSECRSRSRIAIIIPFRNRHKHLTIFLDNIITFLKLQQIEHQIFVVEQTGPQLFNRAALMNVGYKEARKYNFDCYVFHDVDQLPEDLTNWYHCSDEPRHLMASRSYTDYRLRFPLYFGGAISLTSPLIEEMNGFSNNWFGWGGEDDDMLGRLLYFNHSLQRLPLEIGRYTSLPHQKEEEGNPHLKIKSSQQIRDESGQYIATDGLNTMNISHLRLTTEALYTHIRVQIAGPTSAEEEERRRWPPDVSTSSSATQHGHSLISPFFIMALFQCS